jgi:hypothetical protein
VTRRIQPKTAFKTPQREVPARLVGSNAAVLEIPDEVRQGLAACSRRTDGALTRGEMAAAFSVSRRTIARWEALYGFSPERINARVLRYGVENLVGLVAAGRNLCQEESARLGLCPKAILSLAGCMVSRNSGQVIDAEAAQQLVLVAEDDDDRRLLSAWRNPGLGPVLRRILRGLTNKE